jgi:hypothetical protein
MKTPFIWLGSGRAKKRAVGKKGRWLDQAAKSGLPVPAGAILLDEFYQLLLVEGVIGLENGRIRTTNPTWLHQTLYESVRFPRLDNLVAVRAAAAAVTDPQMNVNFNNPDQLAHALCAVWSSFADQRRDVLVMEMIAGAAAGTAVTNTNQDSDTLYNNNIPEPAALPQLGRWKRPDLSLPPHQQRLQMLLRGVRRTFGQGQWQIDWVDDGRICWLLQVQSLSPNPE